MATANEAARLLSLEANEATRRADAAEAKVAERDARIATLEAAIRKAPHALGCAMQLRVCIGKSCTCWKRDFADPMPSVEELKAALGAPKGPQKSARKIALEEAAAVARMHGDGLDGEELAQAILELGAPEGQPPAAPSEAPLDALREAREFLIDLRHELLRTAPRTPADSLSDLPESLRRAGTLARCSAAIRALSAPPLSALPPPPRKAPQEDERGTCFGHLGPPGVNEPHPKKSTCFRWRAALGAPEENT